jgi:hypothetical protein
MPHCFDVIDQVVKAITAKGLREYELPSEVADRVRGQVREMCHQHPIPDYLSFPAVSRSLAAPVAGIG